jgi:hypothetical protein
MAGANMSHLEIEIIGQSQLMFEWLLQQDEKLFIHSVRVWKKTNKLQQLFKNMMAPPTATMMQ